MSKAHCLFVASALMVASAAQARDKEIVIGLQSDRTRPTEIVGLVLCLGYHDYIALVNSKGGVEVYKIHVVEIDNEYKVSPAMEAPDRITLRGEVFEGVYRPTEIAARAKNCEE